MWKVYTCSSWWFCLVLLIVLHLTYQTFISFLLTCNLKYSYILSSYYSDCKLKSAMLSYLQMCYYVVELHIKWSNELEVCCIECDAVTSYDVLILHTETVLKILTSTLSLIFLFLLIIMSSIIEFIFLTDYMVHIYTKEWRAREELLLNSLNISCVNWKKDLKLTHTLKEKTKSCWLKI